MKNISGSCFVIVFGLAFAGMGGAATVFFTAEFIKIAESWKWEKVPAKVMSADVKFPTSPPPSHEHSIYELEVEFSYQYNDQKYQSNSFRLSSRSSDSYEDIALLKRDLLAGRYEYAFVNPNDPKQAILKRDSLWFGFVILLPLLFFTVGVALLLACLPIWGKRESRGGIDG